MDSGELGGSELAARITEIQPCYSSCSMQAGTVASHTLTHTHTQIVIVAWIRGNTDMLLLEDF